ncbi:thiosulfate sulfurtransferase [Allopseudospirillum japonicum]|uniref:Thiosulfate sulfurtransferase GlpE n=1 Tax=Allopseudospirillum japonicum TaxID=64971 RepID=A0A1H6SCH2_9GAMM|nr:thiosulfate sulfurtransferase GlpE [Allopseudospirillum japonicum]SEI61710.1 thiosulfate sulfurtransferase [Allopseudospirillum japonicum]
MAGFKHIQAADAAKMMQKMHVTWVDIRDANSFQQGHILGAQRLDNTNVNAFLAQVDYQNPVIVCCYHGHSSQGAAAFLAEQGFDTVYSLDGGYEVWKLACPHLCESGL